MAEKKDDRLLILVGYVIWIVALILYLVKKNENSKMANFHYLQSLVLGVIGFILSMFTFGLGGLIVWLYGIYLGWKVYQGEDPRPLGKYIEQYA